MDKEGDKKREREQGEKKKDRDDKDKRYNESSITRTRASTGGTSVLPRSAREPTTQSTIVGVTPPRSARDNKGIFKAYPLHLSSSFSLHSSSTFL